MRCGLSITMPFFFAAPAADGAVGAGLTGEDGGFPPGLLMRYLQPEADTPL